MQIHESAEGKIILEACVGNVNVCIEEQCGTQAALKPQTENIIRQLTKLGNTPFECNDVSMPYGQLKSFIPSSLLTHMRRNVTQKLEQAIRKAAISHRESSMNEATLAKGQGSNNYPDRHAYLYNIANRQSAEFYKMQQTHATPAPEINMPNNALLMQCRYCLRHALGKCSRQTGTNDTYKTPLYLRMSDGRRFRLQFDCLRCQMNVIADK